MFVLHEGELFQRREVELGLLQFSSVLERDDPVMLGVLFGAFHLTREETPWILPGLLLLVLALALAAARGSRVTLQRCGISLGVSLATAALPVAIVSTLNARHYDWFGTVEFRAEAFKDAYGALTRVPSPRCARARHR